MLENKDADVNEISKRISEIGKNFKILDNFEDLKIENRKTQEEITKLKEDQIRDKKDTNEMIKNQKPTVISGDNRSTERMIQKLEEKMDRKFEKIYTLL